MAIDFADLMLPVAERLLGPPDDNSKRDVKRWHTKGSLAVDVKKGVWYDHENKEGGGCLDFIRREINGEDPIAWLRKEHFIKDTEIVETFDYPDEQKVLLYQVCRRADGGFYQRRPNGHGGWINNIKGVRRVLYHLPELLAYTGDQVFIPEGEKHVNRLRQLGLCATCNAGGAGKWLKEYSEFLRGKVVTVLTDNDEPGFDHGEKVARSLAGVAKRVRVLLLPGLKPKGDIINWLDAGGTKEELLRLADETPTWEETQPGSPEDGGHFEYVLVRASDVIPRAKNWLWKGRLLRGCLELMTGIPGMGKSQVQNSCVGIATTGEKWPDGKPGIAPINVIMVTIEDPVDQEIVPRLIAAKANQERIWFLELSNAITKTECSCSTKILMPWSI
jgi:hypothetical protein